MKIRDVVEALNDRASSYRFGSLQEWRKERRGGTRRSSRRPFSKRCLFEHYAYHDGGRKELQFNVGKEGKDLLRWGLAFSLKRGSGLPKIDVLFPKIDRFNEFMIVNDEEFRDFRMWHHGGGGRSALRYPDAVPPDVIKEGAFIFMGRLGPVDAFDPEVVLTDFDALLPIYEFVENEQSGFPATNESKEFVFKPGHTPRRGATTAISTRERVDLSLRHNSLQNQLVSELQKAYGDDAVGTEVPSGTGGRIDVVVEVEAGYEFYEIKLGGTARSCIRQALGQLLDYGFWPGGPRPKRLLVVGEPELDAEAIQFIEVLRGRFRLPISYRSIEVA